MGFGYGYGMGFDSFNAMFTIVFLLIIGTFIFTAVKGIGQWNKNNNSPKKMPFQVKNHLKRHILCN